MILLLEYLSRCNSQHSPLVRATNSSQT
jgi:hypothetical protein